MRAGAPGLLIQTGPCWYLKWPTWVLHFDVFLSIYSEWWTFKHRLSNCFVFNSSQWKIQPLILIIFPRLRIVLYFHMFLNDPWLFTCSTSHYLFTPFLLFFTFLALSCSSISNCTFINIWKSMALVKEQTARGQRKLRWC